MWQCILKIHQQSSMVFTVYAVPVTECSSPHTHTFHTCTVVYHWSHSHHTAPCHSMTSCSTKHIGANCPELVRTVQDYPCPERKLLLWFHHDTTVSLLTSICDSTLLESWASDAIGASPQQFTSSMYRKTWRKIWIVVLALKLCALYFFVLKFGWESKHEVANNYGNSYATTSIVLQADPTFQSCIKVFNSYR